MFFDDYEGGSLTDLKEKGRSKIYMGRTEIVPCFFDCLIQTSIFLIEKQLSYLCFP